MTKKILKKIALFLPAILWMSFIFYLSSQSTIGIGQTRTERFVILKSFHLIEYGILLILLYFGFRNLKTSIFVSYLYALSDEFHQSFVPGREGKLYDTFIDLVGILLAAFLIKAIVKSNFIRRLAKKR